MALQGGGGGMAKERPDKGREGQKN